MSIVNYLESHYVTALDMYGGNKNTFEDFKLGSY